MGPGEAALLVAEQDRLDQIDRQGPAVDRHERLARPIRRPVQRTRDDFLADPAFARDQDGDRRLRRPRAQLLDHLHRPAVAHQIGKGGASRHMLLQPPDLGRQLGQLQRVPDPDQDAFRARRLDEEVLGPGLHGLDHSLDAAVGRQHDDRRGHARRADLGQAFHPRHGRHDEVQQHHVGPTALGQPVDGLAAAFGVNDLIALAVQHGLHKAALRRIIVDHQNGLGHGKNTPSSAGPHARDWLVSGRF